MLYDRCICCCSWCPSLSLQLGTYPIGSSTTAEQEPMPLENSGNMLLMLLGIVRAQTRAKTGDVKWIAPYFPMLQTWADELVLTTEFPANQICTDDFTGKLANNVRPALLLPVCLLVHDAMRRSFLNSS